MRMSFSLSFPCPCKPQNMYDIGGSNMNNIPDCIEPNLSGEVFVLQRDEYLIDTV